MSTYKVVQSANFLFQNSSDEEAEEDNIRDAARSLIRTETGKRLKFKKDSKPAKEKSNKKKKTSAPALVPEQSDDDLKLEEVNMEELDEVNADDFFFGKKNLQDMKDGKPVWKGWDNETEFKDEQNITLPNGLSSQIQKDTFDENSDDEPYSQFEEEETSSPKKNKIPQRRKESGNAFHQQKHNQNKKFDRSSDFKKFNKSKHFNTASSNSRADEEYNDFVRQNLGGGNNTKQKKQKFSPIMYTSEDIPTEQTVKRPPLPTCNDDPNGFKSSRGNSRGRGRGRGRGMSRRFESEPQVFSISKLNGGRQPLDTSEDDPNGYKAFRESKRGRGRGRGRFQNGHQSNEMFKTPANNNGKRKPLDTFEDDPNGFKAFQKQKKQRRW